MKLYVGAETNEYVRGWGVDEATQEDVVKWLKERGMVAVPVEAKKLTIAAIGMTLNKNLAGTKTFDQVSSEVYQVAITPVETIAAAQEVTE